MMTADFAREDAEKEHAKLNFSGKPGKDTVFSAFQLNSVPDMSDLRNMSTNDVI